MSEVTTGLTVLYSQFFTCSNPHVDRCSTPFLGTSLAPLVMLHRHPTPMRSLHMPKFFTLCYTDALNSLPKFFTDYPKFSTPCYTEALPAGYQMPSLSSQAEERPNARGSARQTLIYSIIYIYIYIYIYTHIHTYMCVLYIYICVYIYIYVYINKYICIYMYIYIYIYTHTHIHYVLRLTRCGQSSKGSSWKNRPSPQEI